MDKIEYPTFIKESSFTFDIEQNDLDLRLSNPIMDQIPSWKDYPSKQFDKKDDDGKTIRNKNKREHFNSIVLYIIFVFDKKSPFHLKYRDIKKKKEIAAQEASLPEKDGFDEQVLNNENEEVLKMTVDFLTFQNDKMWTEIAVYESLFSEYAGLLFKPINESKDKDLVAATNSKAKIREEFSSVRLQLDRLYMEFYGNDTSLLDKAQKTTRFSPESVSKKLR